MVGAGGAEERSQPPTGFAGATSHESCDPAFGLQAGPSEQMGLRPDRWRAEEVVDQEDLAELNWISNGLPNVAWQGSQVADFALLLRASLIFTMSSTALPALLRQPSLSSSAQLPRRPLGHPLVAQAGQPPAEMMRGAIEQVMAKTARTTVSP